MKNFQKPVSVILVYAIFFSSLTLRAESVEDKFTEISPHFTPGSGEFVHGQGYGKLLQRIIFFGAVPQQGVHYMPEGTDLMFAIIYAGGKTDTTKLNGITIRRRGSKKLIKIELEDLVERGEPIPKLADGDVVNVPYNWHYDYNNFLYLSSVFTSITGLILALVALTQHH